MKKLFTAGVNLQSNNQKPFELQSFRSSFVAAFGGAVFMSWDTDGEILAIIDDKTSSVTLWDSVSSKISQLHTGMKDNLTVLSWSKVGNRLAIGTSKGNLVLYNHKTLKKTSLLGKHTRKVTCSVWNRNNIMALASEDKSITINSVEGDLIKQIIIHDQPSGLSFGQMKLHDISVAQDNTVSCIIGKKKLFLLNLDDMENPLELAFRRMYGDLIAYNWFGDGYIMVGFSNGYFVVISTQSSEIGKEIYQIRDFKDGLHDISVSAILNRCATVHDLQNICELTAIIELEEEEMVENNSNNLNTKSINSNLFKYHIQWSSDGQLLAICTPQKHLHVFLSQLPLLAALAPPNSTGLLARLTSLLEITVEPIPYAKQIINLPPIYRSSYSLKTEVEPTFIGLGQKYLSVGINNHVWFYELTKSDIAFTTEYDYLTTVDQISLNENYAAACGPDGKLTLHWINSKSIPDKSNTTKKQIQLNTVQRNDTNQLSRESCIFPQSTTFDLKITSFKLTNDFLIYSTNRGELFHFYISDWNYANEYHHNCAILHIFPNATGTRVAFIDEKALAFIYNPANDQLIEIPEFCPSINNILWDLEDIENPLLIAYDNLQINVYRYYMNECVLTNSLVPTEKSGNMLKIPIQQITDDNQKSSTTTDKGTSRSNSGTFGTNHRLDSNKSPTRVIFGNCHLVGIARLSNGHLPLCITNGELCMLSPTGRLLTQPLTTHQFRVYTVQIHPTTGQNIFNEQNDISKEKLGIYRLTKLSYPEMVTYFEQALKAGCFEDAELFARQLNSHQIWSQLGMSCLPIRCFRSIQDPSHLSAIQRIQKIEDRYLIAGYVAMVLKEFDKAQELFLVSSEPIAALEMECTGDYVNALMYYERALNVSDDNTEFKALKYSKEYLPPPQRLDCNEDKLSEHVSLCNAGIARNAIRLGDCKRGIKLASTTGNSNLQKECADILEECKQWQEAASLYELAGCYESAVIVSLKCKNYKKVGELLTHVTNAPRLHLQYAKAREADGAYKEAVSAYETAQDLDSVIRVQLEKLNNPNEAIRILNMSRSIEGAKLIAQYFIRTDDPAKAIRFLVMSQCFDAAFDLARKHKKMELYAEVIGYNASISEYQSIACYFENEKNWYLAGKYYLLAKQYEKAVKHLLHVPYKENSPALDLALEAVGQAGDSRLTHLVIIYLMGETDGVVKDARHLFRLYMVLKQYKEAARTAVIIARDEQTNGNYRSAHDLLFSMVQELRQRNIHVPFEMSENLALLHSYILAKNKMCQSLLTELDIVPILTSTVIECQKAGLKSASFSYAAMLLRPEYRDKLDVKYRRKFETLVRRRDLKSEGSVDQSTNVLSNSPNHYNGESSTPCPSCGSPLLETSLYCTECRSTIPYCVITGYHVVKNDFSICPGCHFPALYSELLKYVENCSTPICPMCNTNLSRDTIRRSVDSNQFLSQWINSLNVDLCENATDENCVELNKQNGLKN
ncbi:WD repeat-containing protein 19 [Schistosoma japonicum]|nr:WD repeat-containing protein 19 [Schistosoma japonicum]